MTKDHLGHEVEEQHQKHLPTGKSLLVVAIVALLVVVAVLLYLKKL